MNNRCPLQSNLIPALAAFAGVMTGNAWLSKVTLAHIHKLVMLMLFGIGILLATGLL